MAAATELLGGGSYAMTMAAENGDLSCGAFGSQPTLAPPVPVPFRDILGSISTTDDICTSSSPPLSLGRTSRSPSSCSSNESNASLSSGRAASGVLGSPVSHTPFDFLSLHAPTFSVVADSSSASMPGMSQDERPAMADEVSSHSGGSSGSTSPSPISSPPLLPNGASSAFQLGAPIFHPQMHVVAGEPDVPSNVSTSIAAASAAAAAGAAVANGVGSSTPTHRGVDSPPFAVGSPHGAPGEHRSPFFGGRSVVSAEVSAAPIASSSPPVEPYACSSAPTLISSSSIGSTAPSSSSSPSIGAVDFQQQPPMPPPVQAQTSGGTLHPPAGPFMTPFAPAFEPSANCSYAQQPPQVMNGSHPRDFRQVPQNRYNFTAQGPVGIAAAGAGTGMYMQRTPSPVQPPPVMGMHPSQPYIPYSQGFSDMHQYHQQAVGPHTAYPVVSNGLPYSAHAAAAAPPNSSAGCGAPAGHYMPRHHKLYDHSAAAPRYANHGMMHANGYGRMHPSDPTYGSYTELPAGVVPVPPQQRTGFGQDRAASAQKAADVSRQLEDLMGQMRLHDGAPMLGVPPTLIDTSGVGASLMTATSAPMCAPGVMMNGMHKPHPDPQAAAYASIIKSYASVGDEGGAEEVLRQLHDRKVKPDVVMYNALMSAYATNGNSSGAENVLQRMQTVGVDPNVVTYSSLVNAYAINGNSSGAESVLQRMQNYGVDPNVITYNSLVTAHAKDGSWVGAESVLQRMMQNDHVEPNVTTFNAVINAYANKGHWVGAESVVKRMLDRGVDPNVTTFNSLIDAYASKGHWAEGEDVLKRMFAAGVKPNVITYSSLINAYASRGNSAGAESVLQRMQYQCVQPNVITYNSLVTAYAKEGSWVGAENVLKRMYAAGIEPNVTTYNLLINSYANRGHWKGAEDVLQRMLGVGVEPNVMTYNSLINAHAKDGNWEGAEEVMRRLLERGVEPNVTTFNSIIKAYTKDGQSEGAEDVLRRMQEFNLKPNVTTWSSVINAYATKGDWLGAEDVLARMQEARVEPNVTTFSSVINAYANKGHWAGAEDVLRRMESRGLEPDVITYNSLLKVYANARDVDGCGRGLDLVRQMIDRRLKPTHVTFKTLFTLLLRYPDTMKLQAGLMLLNDHLPIRNRNSPIYAPLIELCGVTGHIEAAAHYFEEARRGGHLDKFVHRAARAAGLLVGGDDGPSSMYGGMGGRKHPGSHGMYGPAPRMLK